MTTGNDNRTGNNDSKYIVGTTALDDVEYVLTDSFGDSYRGNTMDQLIQNFARDFTNVPRRSPLINAELVVRAYVTPNERAFLERMSECIAENNAAEVAAEHAKQMALWEKERAALNAVADDYSESGFAKKMAELMARKPVI